MANDDQPDFLKGFQIDDYDMDLGMTFVDSKPDESPSVSAETVETISTRVEGIGSLEAKVDDLQDTLEGIKNLLNFDEINIEGKLDTILDATSSMKTVTERERMEDLEKLILPLLVNFIKPESLDQDYIYWPNRKEIIERQIQRILQITRGD
jgi:archaellum component FlaC